MSRLIRADAALPHRPARPRHGRRGVRRAAGRARRPRSRRSPGCAPEITGVLTRSRGDFDEILAAQRPHRRAHGRPRPGARLRAARDARRQARRHGEQAAALPARRGAVGRRARARRAAALRGRGRRRRAGHPRAAGVARRRARRAHPRDRQRHDELHPHARWRAPARPTTRRSPRRSGSATPRPTRPTTSTARTRRRRWRSSRGSRSTRPVHLDHVPLRGHRAHHRRRHGVRPRARARPEADRHRRARRRRASACACTRRSSTAAIRWRCVNGPFNAVTVESEAITEITMSRPGRRRPADRERGARRRHQRDDPARLDAGDDASALRDRRRRRLGASTCTSRSPTGPACSRRSRSSSGLQGASIKSVVQKGLGENARAGDGRPPGARVAASTPRVELIAGARLRALARRARSACIDEEFE